MIYNRKYMSRIFAMGDIHGAYKSLRQCLDRSKFDYENDTLIQLGDICDGWSETSQCVDELLKIKNLISIRGNHDVWCNNWFNYGDRPIIWTEQGGRATIESYIISGKIGDKAHHAFWYAQKDYYIDDQNRLFVHGGFELYEGFEETKNVKINIRGANMYHWSRDLAMLRSPSEEELKKIYQFKEIFIGHTHHTHQPIDFNKFNIWNLDTGAGGRFGLLTIMNVDTKEYFQSDRSGVLYYNEAGR